MALNKRFAVNVRETIAELLERRYPYIDSSLNDIVSQAGNFKERLDMSLSDYFDCVQGLGILATADSKGTVDLAVYAKPYVIDENTVAFVMRERLTHQNLKSNPRAAYMFVEQGEGYAGKRLYLTKIREETNTSIVEMFRKKQPEICC